MEMTKALNWKYDSNYVYDCLSVWDSSQIKAGSNRNRPFSIFKSQKRWLYSRFHFDFMILFLYVSFMAKNEVLSGVNFLDQLVYEWDKCVEISVVIFSLNLNYSCGLVVWKRIGRTLIITLLANWAWNGLFRRSSNKFLFFRLLIM